MIFLNATVVVTPLRGVIRGRSKESFEGCLNFVTHDTDNAFIGSPTPIDEVDAQQWQFAVPTDSPHAVGEPYAQLVRVPLVVVATPAP